ncbi:MAG: hypothetical protein EBW58_12860, partial [Betaproteobacteria bacterium]|nr:hypothetical protein [Betaproteobacteria bacterium]
SINVIPGECAFTLDMRAPTDAQRDALVQLLTKMHASAAWKEVLQQRKWTDVFLAGDPFAKELAADIVATEIVLKDLGLA